MAKKKKISEEQLEVQKKSLNILKEHLNVGKEHKDISKKQLGEGMPLNEQRYRWLIGSVVIPLIIATGIIGALFFLLPSIFNNAHENPELKIDVSPSKIRLNENQDINFQINFTNIGKQNLSNFGIFRIHLYRIEDGKPVYRREIISPYNNNRNYDLVCYNSLLDSPYSLFVGSKCSLKVRMMGCPDCFDDKDKTVQLFIYLDSFPPVKSQIINLTIY
ncbi:MAG: hypothetical protein KKE50_00600 [Nanoarchaeota archaeon]|nr:hypothetical protein [Nanoarchaeota archaeon]